MKMDRYIINYIIKNRNNMDWLVYISVFCCVYAAFLTIRNTFDNYADNNEDTEA